MTKYEWETELKKNIRRLPDDEIKRVTDYYGELFADKAERGESEREIVNEFGNPADVADKILSEYVGEIKPQDVGGDGIFPELADLHERGASGGERKQPSITVVRTDGKATAWAVLAALAAAGGACALGGIAGAVISFGPMFCGSVGAGVAQLGMCLAVAGGGALLAVASLYMIKRTARFCKELFLGVRSWLTIKETEVRERMRFEPFRNGLFNIGRFDRYFVLTVGSGVTVKISGSTTDVEFRSASYESVTVRSTNADIGFIDCTLGELSIDSTNLDATFDNCEFGDISVDSVNTDITVRNSRGDSLSVKSTNLTSVVEATLCRAVEHRGDNSDIMFDRVATDRLKVNAVNLDAYILIDGARSDYLLSAPSEVGPDDKIIDIHAVNKDVELKFTR